ncbi:MAG: response regulator [Mojavia pulchra JT2-VF2]|jgi:CheY-like chemotaxis protein|uniref:Response regulator n=1 Tax=Mojavia pulchra JT2-VF2 TaxID=287848 RepID=A0A951PZT0_9NOST|nr:response regulator [Mojavia pulchra JT2-VF2]
MNYILICDDVIDNCILLQLFLEIQGYTVEFVTSGIEAINKIRLKKPDLLLLDVMMPDISGFEVVKVIREDKCLQNLPILLVTAYKELFEPQLTNTQVNGVIYKPVDPDVLFERVNEVL